MSTTLFHVGNHPLLSAAELTQQSIVLFPLSPYIFTTTQPVPPALLGKLGGTKKISVLVKEVPYASWEEIEKNIQSFFPDSAHAISIYDEHSLLTPQQKRKASDLIKQCAQVRPHGKNPLQLASQQAFTLVKKQKIELNIIITASTIYFSQTIAVQDTQAYTHRDIQRPHLLKKTGMLPPKLAQIMLNLAGLPSGSKVLDPCCGSGLLLQEALLQHLLPWGTDINPKTVALCRENLQWFLRTYNLNSKFSASSHIKHGDATTKHTFSSFHTLFDAVVTEGELGPNFSYAPSMSKIETLQKELTALYRKFLLAVHPHLKRQGKVVISFPYWRVQKKSSLTRIFLPNSLIQTIQTFGYKLFDPLPSNLISTSPLITERNSLLYERPQQFVGREIIIFQKK